MATQIVSKANKKYRKRRKIRTSQETLEEIIRLLNIGLEGVTVEDLKRDRQNSDRRW